MAEKIKDVREERDRLKEEVEALNTDLDELLDTVRRHHEETHAGVFRWCASPVCKLAGTFDVNAEARPFA